MGKPAYESKRAFGLERRLERRLERDYWHWNGEGFAVPYLMNFLAQESIPPTSLFRRRLKLDFVSVALLAMAPVAACFYPA